MLLAEGENGTLMARDYLGRQHAAFSDEAEAFKMPFSGTESFLEC